MMVLSRCKSDVMALCDALCGRMRIEIRDTPWKLRNRYTVGSLAWMDGAGKRRNWCNEVQGSVEDRREEAAGFSKKQREDPS